jgi:hypothetical protein
MESATVAHTRTGTHRNRKVASDRMRRRALARLYERRSEVSGLIAALQRYQEQQRRTRGESAEASAEEMS